MKNYNLNENVDETFEFTLGGVLYKMRYPNGEERREMAKIGQAAQAKANEAQVAMDIGDSEKADTLVEEATKEADKLSEFINKLVSTDVENAPSIEDALEKATTPVVRNFQEMIQAELSMDAPQKKLIKN